MARAAHKPGAIPRLRVRRQKSGVVYYYYDHGGRPRRETPLGKDYGLAIQGWCRIEHTRLVPVAVTPTLRQVVEHYRVDVVRKLPPPLRQRQHNALDRLLRSTDDPDRPLPSIALRPNRRPLPTVRAPDATTAAIQRIAPLWRWCLRRGYVRVR